MPDKRKSLPLSGGSDELPVPFLEEPEKQQVFDAPKYGIPSSLGFEQKHQDVGIVFPLPRYKLQLNDSAGMKS